MGPNGEGRRTSTAESDRADPAARRSVGIRWSAALLGDRRPRRHRRPTPVWHPRLHAAQIIRGIPLLPRVPASCSASTDGSAASTHSFLLIADVRGPAPSGSSPAPPTCPACTRASSGTTGYQPRSGAAGRLIAGWRRVLETLRPRIVRRSRSRSRRPSCWPWPSTPAGRGEEPAGCWWRPSSMRSSAAGYDAAHVVVGADNSGAIALYQHAGFVTARALRAPSGHRIPPHAVGSAADRADFGRGRSLTGPAIGVAAFVVTLCLTPLVIVVATRSGIVDRPGPLKPQSRAGPLPGWGGRVRRPGRRHCRRPTPDVGRSLVAALGLGVADDRFDLSAAVPPDRADSGRCRRGGRPARSICPTASPSSRSSRSPWWSINGVNLIDGLDLLAAGVAAVAAVGLRPHSPRIGTTGGHRPCRRPGRLPRLQPATCPGVPG